MSRILAHFGKGNGRQLFIAADLSETFLLAFGIKICWKSVCGPLSIDIFLGPLTITYVGRNG